MTSQIDATAQQVSEYAPPLQERGLYGDFYNLMRALQEDFHRFGTLPDANSKLEEIARLFAVERVASLARRTDLRIRTVNVAARAGGDTTFAAGLRDLFREARACATSTAGAARLFAADDELALRNDDDPTARALVSHFERWLPHGLADEGAFDVLSEAFSAFVRQNFRQRLDDAQYMTPLELTRPAALACARLLGAVPGRRVVVADPTCGVGTFLGAARSAFARLGCDAEVQVVGIDKVPRMARLARLNLSSAVGCEPRIEEANTILSDQWAAGLEGRVDLVITNPPFGAMFEAGEVDAVWGGRAPFVHAGLARGALQRSSPLPSELVLFDIYTKLVRPGGLVGIVVPDGVVAAKGLAERFREFLLARHELLASVELPSETFAQAGTRTNTSFLIVRVGTRATTGGVRFGVVRSLGFEVVRRKGSPVKREVGENLATGVFEWVASASKDGELAGTTATTPVQRLVNGRLRASAYVAAPVARGTGRAKLEDLVEPEARRERGLPTATRPMISVKFVNQQGLIDLQLVEGYRPITPGSACLPGDVLLSRINPHIPRVCVVPDLWADMLCSTEFMVLRPSKASGLTPYELRTLLTLPENLAAIQGLAGGTSSSHSRVKDVDLLGLALIVPKGERWRRVRDAARIREESEARIYKATHRMLRAEARTVASNVVAADGKGEQREPRDGSSSAPQSRQGTLALD